MLLDTARCASMSGSQEPRSGRPDCSSKNAHGQAPADEGLPARCRRAKAGDGGTSSQRVREEPGDAGSCRAVVAIFRGVSSLGRVLPARLTLAVRTPIYRMIGTQFVSGSGRSA